jgi:hypothetical protein
MHQHPSFSLPPCRHTNIHCRKFEQHKRASSNSTIPILLPSAPIPFHISPFTEPHTSHVILTAHLTRHAHLTLHTSHLAPHTVRWTIWTMDTNTMHAQHVAWYGPARAQVAAFEERLTGQRYQISGTRVKCGTSYPGWLFQKPVSCSTRPGGLTSKQKCTRNKIAKKKIPIKK